MSVYTTKGDGKLLALELEKTEVKGFMGQLLRESVFDKFEVRSVEIATNIHIDFDGALADTDEHKKTCFTTWENLRPLVYGIVKASPKPKCVKIIFSCNNDDACSIHPNAAALFLNLGYENDNVTFTTGVAQKEFIMDKTLDINWDEWVKNFFCKVGVNVAERI